jgi:hypothetical protein
MPLLWVLTLSCVFAYVAPRQGRVGDTSSPPSFGFPIYSNVHGIKVYRVGGSIKSPEPVSCPDTVPKAQGEPAGDIFISAVIDTKGRVRFPRITAGLGPNEDKLALAEVRQCSFKPARKGNEAVAVQAQLNLKVH